MRNNDKLRQDYINSLDSFIADNPVVNGLDTLKFRDFLIGLVEHESSFNPNARQGSYYGWYQTDKHDSDPYKQHLNAFNHLSNLFKNTITQADITQARKLGINDAALMLKYWNQGNRVNNYIWNNQDNQDGLGTKISEYGNDLTMPLDVYDYATKNIYGDYTVKSGDSWFNIQKRVRVPGRDYNTAGKDLWNMQDTTGIYGLLKPGQKFSFGDDPNVNNSILNINKIKALSNKVNPDWYADMIKKRDTNNLNQSLYYQKGGALVYHGFNSEEFENDNFRKAKDLDIEDFKMPVYNERFPVEPVSITTPITTIGSTPTQPIQTQETTQLDQVTQPTQPVQPPAIIHDSEEWTERDLGILNSDGSNKDKQRITNKYLREKLGLTKEQAAALVGIWQAESNFKLDAANQAEKAGKNSSVKSSQYGIGIGQWTHSRHDDFVNYINTHGGNYSLKNQLDFAIEEIKTKYPEFLSNLRSASNLKDATAYAYVQYVGANEKNIKDSSDLYARVNKTINRYRQKHLELYGKATNGFEQRLKFANDSLNIS